MPSQFPTAYDNLRRDAYGEAITALQVKVGIDGEVAGGASVEARLKDLEAGGGGGGVPTTRLIDTTGSIIGGSDLAADLSLSLENDSASPGANKVYGTDGSGVRGWKSDPSGGGGLTQPQVLARGLGA